MPKAFVRTIKLKSKSDVGATSRHAKGMDATSKARRREDALHRCVTLEADNTLQVHKVDSPELDLSAAFEAHLVKHNAKLRKGAAIALHMIVGVSPEWVADGGDPHDANNPHVGELLRAARDWAEREIGGVWSVRYDLDEKGSSVVDILASPIRAHQRSGQHWVSTRRALRDLAEREGKPKSRNFVAMQDTWHRTARERLDPAMQRGEDAKKTGLKHKSPEEYGELQDERRLVADERASLKSDARRVLMEVFSAEHARAKLRADQRALAAERASLERDRKDFCRQVREVLGLLGKRIVDAGGMATRAVRDKFAGLVWQTGEHAHDRTGRIFAAARSSRIRLADRAGRDRSVERESQRARERLQRQRRHECESGREREGPGFSLG